MRAWALVALYYLGVVPAAAKDCPEPPPPPPSSYLHVNVSSKGSDSANNLRCVMPNNFSGYTDTAFNIQKALFINAQFMCERSDVIALHTEIQTALDGCPDCHPVALVQRGNCYFDVKLNYTREVMAGFDIDTPTVLVIDYWTCGPSPDAQLKYGQWTIGDLQVGALRTGFCPHSVGAALYGMNTSASVSFSTLLSSESRGWDAAEACPPAQCIAEFDGSLFLLLALATGAVVVGSHGSGSNLIRQRQALAQLPVGAPRPPPTAEEEQVVITAKMASVYGIFASAGLLLMYLFLDYIVRFMVVYVVVVATFISWINTSDWVMPYVPGGDCHYTLPKLGRCSVTSTTIFWLELAVGLTFYIYRHQPWSWALQDYLCLNLCVYVIKTFELPNAKVATILLCALFAYDVFWVYLSPYAVAFFATCKTAANQATDPNNSVMVAVAKGVPSKDDGTPAERIPIVIRMPKWGGTAGAGTGVAGDEAMLGLGDIIVPALSLAMFWRVDLAAGRSWSRPVFSASPGGGFRANPRHFLSGYFCPSLVGYVLALCCAYWVVATWCYAQPALFYIVPLSLWSTLGYAACRSELSQLWAVGPDKHWTPPAMQQRQQPSCPARANNSVQSAESAAARHTGAGAGGDTLSSGLIATAERTQRGEEGRAGGEEQGQSDAV